MSVFPFDRRDFARLSIAAAGGLFTGVELLASEPPPGKPAASTKPDGKPRAAAGKAESTDAGTEPKDKASAATPAAKEKFKEVHICRGLNTCEGKGLSGKNKCAGQGDCATTTAAPHECSTGNACNGQGGCGPTAGKNQCAGYGDGGVPIIEEEWPRLRKEFEARMKRLKLPYGKAPGIPKEEKAKRAREEAKARAIAEAEIKKAEAEAKSETEALEGALEKGELGKTPKGKGSGAGQRKVP